MLKMEKIDGKVLRSKKGINKVLNYLIENCEQIGRADYFAYNDIAYGLYFCEKEQKTMMFRYDVEDGSLFFKCLGDVDVWESFEKVEKYYNEAYEFVKNDERDNYFPIRERVMNRIFFDFWWLLP